MSKTRFKTQLRAAAAYHGLSLGSLHVAHDRGSLWSFSEGYGARDTLATSTFTESLEWFSQANNHFSRIRGLAAYILSFPDDHPAKNEFLRQIEEIASDKPLEASEEGYFFSLSRIFHEARKRFEGAGAARLAVNPTGLLQNAKSFAPLVFVCNAFASYLPAVIISALVFSNPLLAISGAGSASLHFLHMLVDPRAKQAYYSLYQLDKENQKRSVEEHVEASEISHVDDVDTAFLLAAVTPSTITTHQRWMFESYPSDEDNQTPSLGKDITELMLYQFNPRMRATQLKDSYGIGDEDLTWKDEPLLLNRILDNLIKYKNDPTSPADKEEAIHAFFEMDLSNWDREEAKPFTFVDAIINKPAYVAKYLNFIKTFELNRSFALLSLLVKRKSSLITEIADDVDSYAATFQSQSSLTFVIEETLQTYFQQRNANVEKYAGPMGIFGRYTGKAKLDAVQKLYDRAPLTQNDIDILKQGNLGKVLKWTVTQKDATCKENRVGHLLKEFGYSVNEDLSLNFVDNQLISTASVNADDSERASLIHSNHK